MTASRPVPFVLALALALSIAANALSQEAPAAARAGVHDLSWIAGSWAGSSDGDGVEETWLPAAGGAMVGVFRWLKDGEVFLYELMTIDGGGGAPVLKIKHFGPDLAGWEEKADAVVFDLVEAGEGHAVFAERGDEGEGTRLVYRREAGGGLTVTFEETRGGEPVEIVFRYEAR